MYEDNNDKQPNHDYVLMLTEVSKYFKVKYKKMVYDMTKDDIKRLWHILHNRRS